MANTNLKKLINMIAFCGLVMIAFALILGKLLEVFGVNSVEVLNAIRLVGECIAYIVTAIYAYFYVRSKRNMWWWVAYIVAVVVIVVLLIL